MPEVDNPSLIQPLWQAERRAIERAIALCNGSVHEAAKHLEVAPSTLYRKIQAWTTQPGLGSE